MIFRTAGRLLSPLAKPALRGLWAGTKYVGIGLGKGALSAGASTLKYGGQLLKHVNPLTAGSFTWETGQAIYDVAKHHAPGLRALGRQILKPDPQGPSLANAFTGQALRSRAVLAVELGALGYVFSGHTTPNISVRASAAATPLPYLAASGNPNALAASGMRNDPYDKLMGARGSLAFAMRNLRHG